MPAPGSRRQLLFEPAVDGGYGGGAEGVEGFPLTVVVVGFGVVAAAQQLYLVGLYGILLGLCVPAADYAVYQAVAVG